MAEIGTDIAIVRRRGDSRKIFGNGCLSRKAGGASFKFSAQIIGPFFVCVLQCLIQRYSFEWRVRHAVGQSELLSRRQTDGARQAQQVLGPLILRGNEALLLRLHLNLGAQFINARGYSRNSLVASSLVK